MPNLPKHLRQGDPKPEINPKHYTLFGHRFCPYVDRVRYTLQYHQIEFDPIFVALDSKPDWFLEIYPTGKVPVLLTTDGQSIVESDVIMRFVDKLRGENSSLFDICGEVDFQRACELSSKLAGATYNLLFRGVTGNDVEQGVLNACLEINKAIKGPFFVGPDLSLADLALLPFLNRLEPALAILSGIDASHVEEFKTSDPRGKQWPVLLEYLLCLRRLPFVAEVRSSARSIAEFAASMRSGHPEPDK